MADFVGPLDPDVPPFAFDVRGTLPAPKETRKVQYIRYCLVHRAGGPDWPTDAVELAHALLPHWPGNALPYWAMVEPSGRVVVGLDLEHRAAHAASWNSTSLGIAAIGDFRHHQMPDEQRAALVRLIGWAGQRLGFDYRAVYGHTEAPGTPTKHLKKQCPGRFANMILLRSQLMKVIP